MTVEGFKEYVVKCVLRIRNGADLDNAEYLAAIPANGPTHLPATPDPMAGSLTSPFDSIQRVDEAGDFWLAREMQPELAYVQWRNMEKVLAKAKAACRNNGQDPADHFADVGNMVEVGSGATRSVADVRLSRYACYLVAMNGDPEKPEVAAAQSYFAIMTRKAEIAAARPQPPRTGIGPISGPGPHR